MCRGYNRVERSIIVENSKSCGWKNWKNWYVEINHVALDIKLHQTAYRVVNPLKLRAVNAKQGRAGPQDSGPESLKSPRTDKFQPLDFGWGFANGHCRPAVFFGMVRYGSKVM